MFKAAYADAACKGDGSAACPFVAPIRDLSTGQLTDITFEAEACAKVDKGHRYDYQRVATRAENIIVMRAGNFLMESGQDTQYIDWEKEKMKIQAASTQR